MPLSKARRDSIAKKQNMKCANDGNTDIPHMNDYECKLWKYEDGCFDSSGWEIDHFELTKYGKYKPLHHTEHIIFAEAVKRASNNVDRDGNITKNIETSLTLRPVPMNKHTLPQIINQLQELQEWFENDDPFEKILLTKTT